VSVHLGIWLTYHTLAGQNAHHRDLQSLRLVTQHVSPALKTNTHKLRTHSNTETHSHGDHN